MRGCHLEILDSFLRSSPMNGLENCENCVIVKPQNICVKLKGFLLSLETRMNHPVFPSPFSLVLKSLFYGSVRVSEKVLSHATSNPSLHLSTSTKNMVWWEISSCPDGVEDLLFEKSRDRHCIFTSIRPAFLVNEGP